MAWKDNAIMFWYSNGVFVKVTDHGRAPLTVSIERIERSQRMVNGVMRRYTVAKKRTWSANWENIPSTNSKVATGGLATVDGGMAGDEIETFHNSIDGSFPMQLRRGDGTIEVVNVMITDFNKEVVKRGPQVDLWNLGITLTEV